MDQARNRPKPPEHPQHKPKKRFPFRLGCLEIIVDSNVNLGRMTGRNQDAIKKTTSGLLKILFPHRTPETVQPDELTIVCN